MAKTKRKVRRVYHKARKKVTKARAKSMKVLGVDLITDLALPGTYGYVRSDIAIRARPLIEKLPMADKLGNVADEVGMIVINTLASRFLGRQVPLIRKIARQGIRIEAATIGAVARAGQLGFGTGAAPSNAAQSFR